MFTVDFMEDLIRAELNENTTARITAAEILLALNIGSVEVATRALCIEKETYTITTSGRSDVQVAGVRVNFIGVLGSDGGVDFDDGCLVFVDDDVTWYKTSAGTSEEKGLRCISPTEYGYSPVKGTAPERWFNWGANIVIEPTPDARYILKLYYSDYPDELVNSTDVPNAPTEFHPCIIDYALSMLCIKLKRWADVAAYYNKYLKDMQTAKAVYVKKSPDLRSAQKAPDSVKEVKNA
jgi:hypothetical protein